MLIGVLNKDAAAIDISMDACSMYHLSLQTSDKLCTWSDQLGLRFAGVFLDHVILFYICNLLLVGILGHACHQFILSQTAAVITSWLHDTLYIAFFVINNLTYILVHVGIRR